ncbi:MAG TPA: hypothetical protein V6C58_22575, partial [Allocoleopsis sp.]
MLGSQLLQLIKSLTKRDRRELRKVVRSPYFNQRDEVIALFDFIDKNLEGKSPDFSKEYVFKTLNPSKKYDDLWMRQQMSTLLQIIQKYLITEGVINDENSSKLYLITALRQRSSDKLFEKEINQVFQDIE